MSVSEEQAAKLLFALNNRRFAVRDKAYKELEQMGEAVHSILQKAAQEPLQLETLRRVEALLERLRKAEASPELVFARRAIGLLERVGSREARQLLTTLAGGVPDAYLTRYARSATGQ